ncbi:hypothetical protein ABEB36_000447 [Hypothenemus hampei]|uniref:RNA helicase n=1 Tax=Hypothenemus hampei TaxID=57062 RepID=A0ABD1FB74_HYPHA
MFNYLKSLFVSNTPSFEDIVSTLTEDLADLTEDKPNENCEDDHYNFSTKIGTITNKNDSGYFINHLYHFIPEESDTFEIGNKVSYQKLVTEGQITIYNVTALDDEWGSVTERHSYATTRVMVCQVTKRDKRLLYLTPGDIKVNLDKVSIEFIPYEGDWLECHVKCEVNERALDLSGEVFEVDKITPLRNHIESGKITQWNGEVGRINQNVFVDSSVLSCGYIPLVGDKVVVEVIESDQNECCWRALKVLPETIGNKMIETKTRIESKHCGLEISDCEVIFDELNENKQVVITLTNLSTEDVFELLSVEAITKGIVPESLKPQSLSPSEKLQVNLACTATTKGLSNEFLQFHFNSFSIGKFIRFSVGLLLTNQEFRQQKPSINYSNCHTGDKDVIRGQRRNATRFSAIRIPEYPLPQKLLNLVIKYGNDWNDPNLIEELKVTKRSLFNDLTSMNYEEKFHTLLHLEEIVNLIHIRQYDQDRACFIQNKEFLMLEIENLAERRPSIVIGDKIMAGDPLGLLKQEYEGNVYKIGAKHIYLKFSSLFHEMYKGEDYSVRVIPGRSSYKRQHHAIFLAARNLGKEWLFPTRILEKSPQSEVDPTNMQWYNNSLNQKQKDAVLNVIKAISRPLPYIIFGPPGTGKTVTIIESVLQILKLVPKCRILVSAPSNSAADLLALRLIDSEVLKPGQLVRLVGLNYALSENIPIKLVPYCATGSLAKEGTQDENNLWGNGMVFDCSRTVLGRHRVTVATCSSSGILHLMGFPRGHFTHIFIDEAGQVAEPELMIPASFLDRYNGQIVLAGDPMQLGPVSMCKVAGDCGLSESFLERLLNRFPYVRDIRGFPDSEGYDPRLVTKLLYNYRSLSLLLKLFSQMFYHNELIPTINDETSKEIELLKSLKSIMPVAKTGPASPIIFHGVDGDNYQTADSPSWYNPQEVAQVFYYVNGLVKAGLKADQIGIITPYNKQSKEIRRILQEAEFDLPRIGTVEDFQGQEFDVIILSTVRSSKDYLSYDLRHSLGFVANPKRLNVAISRPKCLLIIIGNPALLSQDTYWRTVIDYCVNYGIYTH